MTPVDSGKPPDILVQKAPGHLSLATAQIYTHIVDEEPEDALKSFRKTA